jgi:hypothetical protein
MGNGCYDDKQQNQCSTADDNELAYVALWWLRLHQVRLPELLLWLWWILMHDVSLLTFSIPYH